MSFAETKEQIQAETKTETRRDGWENLKVGDLLRPVEKAQGLKKGEKVVPLLPPGRAIQVTAVFREPLKAITALGVRKEGFPGEKPKAFVERYCRLNGGDPNRSVTVIKFKYVDVPAESTDEATEDPETTDSSTVDDNAEVADK